MNKPKNSKPTLNKGYLKQDIFSHSGKLKDKSQYGHQGDKVTVISDRDGVLIVENDKGIRFPVRSEFVLKTK